MAPSPLAPSICASSSTRVLSFNGVTRIVLVAWPLAAAAWLFALAGAPGWGQAPDEPAEQLREADPL